jgi:hypothetical protein
MDEHGVMNNSGDDESQLDRPAVTLGDGEVQSGVGQTLEDKTAFGDEVEQLPWFGVFQLSLTRAANMIAADIWIQDEDALPVPGFGEWEAPAPDNVNFLRALEPYPTILRGRLIESVANGSPTCSRLVIHLMTGAVIPERTYVDYHVLTAWLAQHDYRVGEHFENYAEEEQIVRAKLAYSLFDIRNVQANLWRLHDETKPWHNPLLTKTFWEHDENGNQTPENLRTIVNAYAAQIRYLTQQLEADGSLGVESGLHPKARNSFCRVIFALCSQAKIDLKSRSAVGEIVRLTEDVGLEVGDDTVRKILQEVRRIGFD